MGAGSAGSWTDLPKSRRRRGFSIDPARVARWLDTISLPFVIFFVLSDRAIHPAYGMSWYRKFRLGWRLFRINRAMRAGTSWRAVLVMASKLLQFPPGQRGVVVECGCWRGGATAMLSVVCDIADRQLIVYDSFEGLPEACPGDEMAVPSATGLFRASLLEVRANVRKYGEVNRCTFVKGWFEDTLPGHEGEILLAYLDVDYQKSLHDCVTNLWPWLVDTGYVFLDEYLVLSYCGLFWSERWWQTHFDRQPPGLIGAGTGVGVGQFWVGPYQRHGRIGSSAQRPWQRAHSTGYTRKDFCGYWGFYPDTGTESGQVSGQK